MHAKAGASSDDTAHTEPDWQCCSGRRWPHTLRDGAAGNEALVKQAEGPHDCVEERFVQQARSSKLKEFGGGARVKAEGCSPCCVSSCFEESLLKFFHHDLRSRLLGGEACDAVFVGFGP